MATRSVSVQWSVPLMASLCSRTPYRFGQDLFRDALQSEALPSTFSFCALSSCESQNSIVVWASPTYSCSLSPLRSDISLANFSPSNSVMAFPSQRTLSGTVGTKKGSGEMKFGFLTIWFARKKFSAGDIVHGTCGTDPSWHSAGPTAKTFTCGNLGKDPGGREHPYCHYDPRIWKTMG